MKKRRTFLGLFMLLSLAFVGVGYAALTNTLTVNGTLNATKNDSNLNVQFVASKAAARTSTGAEDTSFTVTHSATDKTATVNINGISDLGSYAEVCYVIKNNSEDLDVLNAFVNTELDIKMVAGSVDVTTEDRNANPNIFEGDHFQVEGEITTDYPAVDAAQYGTLATDDGTTKGLDLDVGEVCYLKITVTLVAPVLDDTVDTHTFTITFNATTEKITLPVTGA